MMVHPRSSPPAARRHRRRRQSEAPGRRGRELLRRHRPADRRRATSSITSILSDPSADPHLYEPGTRNGLAVSHARLVIQNGVGYDAFMQRLEDASPSSDSGSSSRSPTSSACTARTRTRTSGTTCRSCTRSRRAIAAGLERADPPHAAAYRSGLRRFESSLGAAAAARWRGSGGRSPGTPVAYTEPVPGYLLAAAGLAERRARSVHARDRGRHASRRRRRSRADDARWRPARRSRVLLYNSQAVSPITQRIRDAATKAGIPVDRRHRDAAAGPDVPAVAARAGEATRTRPSNGDGPVVSVRDLELALRRARRSGTASSFDLARRRVPRRARPERHRQDVAAPDPARTARADGGQRRGRGTAAAVERARRRLRPAAARLRPRPAAARARPRALRPRRQPLGRRPVSAATGRARDRPGARRGRSDGVRRRARSAGSRAASSSGCASRRHSSPIRSCCSPTSRCSRSTSPTRRSSRASSTSTAGEPGTPIVFVTHDVNPVLPIVDRVLYLAPGRWAIGTPDEVLTSETLSTLYDTEIDVLRVRGRDRRRRHAGRPARAPHRRGAALMFVQLLGEHFVHTALLAGAVVAVISGAIGTFVVTRGASFAVHAISELGFTGAAAALVLGIDVGRRDDRRLARRRPRARAPLASRSRARQRDRRGALVRARRRRAVPLPLPGLRDRGDEPALREHRRRQRRAAAESRRSSR